MANAQNLDTFLKVIDELEINLSQSADGVFTVCSNAEPLFCFDGDSREELNQRVINTLQSYGRHFYGLDLTGHTENRPLADGLLPVERSTPISRLKPVFDLAA